MNIKWTWTVNSTFIWRSSWVLLTFIQHPLRPSYDFTRKIACVIECLIYTILLHLSDQALTVFPAESCYENRTKGSHITALFIIRKGCLLAFGNVSFQWILIISHWGFKIFRFHTSSYFFASLLNIYRTVLTYDCDWGEKWEVKMVTIWDRIRNMEITEELKTKPILEYPEKKQLGWWGRLKRRKENMPVKTT